MKHTLFLLMIILCSCSIIPKPDCAVKRFTVQSKVQLLPKLNLKNVVMHIDSPQLNASISSQRPIVYLSPYQLEFLAGTEWHEDLDKMIQESFLTAFQDSQTFRSVQSKSISSADYCLKIQVRNFGLDVVDNSKFIHLTYYAQIIKLPEYKIISEKLFDQRHPHKWKNDDSYVRDLNSTNDQIIKDLYNFATTELSHLP